ncbi:hypothetical protein ACHAXR_013299 [Thalassiosira sp. AJA248-18]
MKGYGSTNDPITTPPRGDGASSGSPYTTPQQQGRPLMPRNESAGGTTTQTQETEPLLGEQLLLGTDDDEGPAAPPDPRWLSPDAADASTIEKVGSDHEDSSFFAPDEAQAVTPKQSGSPNKHIHRPDSDPHIGINVITNELDTLAYSRDPDESTLLTNDNFTRKYLQSVDEGGNRKGLLRRLLSKGESTDPPYMLVCLGLAVGIGLCSIAALAYVQYSHHQGRSAISDENITSLSSEGTWHGVPYAKIGRESFGDPVTNIFDVSLFHPSLLYDGKQGKEPKTEANKDHAEPSMDDDSNRRLASASPKPFLRVPFPTGAFWTNLVLLPRSQQAKQGASSSTPKPHKIKNQYSYPIVAYPYSYQWSALGKIQASYSASRRVVQENSIQDAFLPDISLGSVEDITTRHVVKFDSLSVTLKFTSSDASKPKGDGSAGYWKNWETYIVQGSPYITGKYTGLAPELTAMSDFVDIACPPTFEAEVQAQPKQKVEEEQDEENRRASDSSTGAGPATTSGKKLGICGTTKDSTKQKKAITGVQFVVTTKEQLTWLVFASEPITFEFNQAARHVIQSRDQYGGVIRLALVPPPTSASGGTTKKSLDIEHLASSSGVRRLVYHAGAYPVGGKVSWDFRSGARNPLASSTFPNISSNKGHRRMSEHVRKQRRMTAETPKENNIGRIKFAFDTICPTTDVPLLMLSLPHHAASITSAGELLLHQKDFDLVYRSIKGRMVPVVGSTWTYEEELTFTGFGDESLPAKTNIAQTSTSSATSSATSQRPIVHESTAISTLDQSVRDLLLQTVESDLKINLPVVANGAYGFGKQIARMAQLAHIAEVVDAANVKQIDELVDRIKNPNNGSQTNSTPPSTSMPSDTVSSVPGSGTARRGYALLEKYLTMWLVSGGMAYDAQLGGILSREGMDDINADFGNARYNDHHFHYGYVLYASAILGRANPKFISQYGPFVDALFYDVAHISGIAKPNDDKDIFFPLARHKSWFDGHSFASGLFPFANGKSQESSSEAVNCYYGAYLWSRVRWSSGDRKMVDFARLLLATEMTGAKTYWHMTPPQDSSGSSTNSTTTTLASAGGKSLIPVPYNSAFRGQYMVGNLGMTDVTCTTWFGTENIYVHLINFMPVTAITAELFDKGYVKGERSVLPDSDSVENAWKGYSVCNEAIIDPNNAWIDAQSVVSTQLDAGLSKSQVLFWVSTREGFSSGTTVEVDDEQSSIGANREVPDQSAPSNNDKGGSNSLARCTNHDKCVAENLTGLCCPTTTGIFLRCCS